MESANTQIDFRRLRLNAGLSVSEAAAATGYAVRTIHRWDRGETTPRKAAVEYLRGQRATAAICADAPFEFTFIDLFAGIGGLRLGFEAIGGNCVFTSEWDRFCQLTYHANFGADKLIAGDVVSRLTSLEAGDYFPH